MTGVGVGDAGLSVRYRAQPAAARIRVPRPGSNSFPNIVPHNFVDSHVLAMLRRLNLSPAELCNDATFLLALGEMGRKPKIEKPKEAGAGRDHWDYSQFEIAAGGGFNRGCIVGATDNLGEQVTEKFYKIESFGRTLYHLLGIDADTLVPTPANRPVTLSVEVAPIIKDAIS